MKTLRVLQITIFAALFIFLTGYSSYAIKPALAPAEHIQKVIKETLKYPEQAIKSGYTGSVDVTFTISDDGKIIVKKLSTDDKEIAANVKEQLSNICCKDIKSPYNQHYKVTITFKLV
jgi:outer membrane biosynthesis protein TonB